MVQSVDEDGYHSGAIRCQFPVYEACSETTETNAF